MSVYETTPGNVKPTEVVGRRIMAEGGLDPADFPTLREVSVLVQMKS